MSRLQNLTLATIISILGTNTIKIYNVDASVFKNKFISNNQVTDTVNDAQLAQNPNTTATESNSSNSEEEMIDALQERQQVIEKNLEKINNLQDDNKINNKKLKALQKKQLNIKSVEELEEIQKIVNDENLDSNEKLKALQKKQLNIKSTEELGEIQEIINNDNLGVSALSDISKPLAFKMLTIGLPAILLVIAVATPLLKGVIGVISSNFQQKFGKPEIPDRSLNLHHDALKEINIIGKQVEKVNDEKFTSEEFKLLIQIKIDIAKGTEGYQELNYQVELLKAAIIAQKSFLKLEATELRYRSRKQQEFYQYIAEHLEAEIDKEEFAKRIKKKQTEILPLINTEEGREAINSYAQEINAISKHELGLKLLALFKKYDLQDFSIIKQIADAIEGLQGYDLLSPKRLVAYVREYYDLFDKIAPILGIPKNNNAHATYARILQVIGLNNRHGGAYLEFKELVRLLQRWERSYGTITMVREQFSPQEYQIPSEFQQDIPGTSIYQKYAQYLAAL
jgi:hypothetical protein